MKWLTLLIAVSLAVIPPAQASITSQIRQAFRPYGQSSRAVCIAWHESTLRPWAWNGANIGLFEINYLAWPMFSRARLFGAAYNIRAAVWIYRRSGGWGPWSTRGMC